MEADAELPSVCGSHSVNMHRRNKQVLPSFAGWARTLYPVLAPSTLGLGPTSSPYLLRAFSGPCSRLEPFKLDTLCNVGQVAHVGPRTPGRLGAGPHALLRRVPPRTLKNPAPDAALTPAHLQPEPWSSLSALRGCVAWAVRPTGWWREGAGLRETQVACDVAAGGLEAERRGQDVRPEDLETQEGAVRPAVPGMGLCLRRGSNSCLLGGGCSWSLRHRRRRRRGAGPGTRHVTTLLFLTAAKAWAEGPGAAQRGRPLTSSSLNPKSFWIVSRGRAAGLPTCCADPRPGPESPQPRGRRAAPEMGGRALPSACALAVSFSGRKIVPLCLDDNGAPSTSVRMK